MIFKTTALALPLLAMGSLANAQSVEYLSYGASYTNLDGGGTDVDVFGLGASLDYRNNEFVFNGGISYTDLDGSGDLTALNFRLGYFVTRELAVYAGYNYADFNSDDVSTFDIGGEYAFGAYTVGLNYSESDVDGTDSAQSIYGGYQVSEDLELSVFVSDQDNDTLVSLAADYDRGDTELFATYTTVDNVDIFAFNGNYDLNNGFRVGGGYVDLDGDFDLFTVSGGYEVADSLWVDVSFGQLDANTGSDADLIGLAISYETGRETLLVDRIETVRVQSLGVLGPITGVSSF